MKIKTKLVELTLEQVPGILMAAIALLCSAQAWCQGSADGASTGRKVNHQEVREQLQKIMSLSQARSASENNLFFAGTVAGSALPCGLEIRERSVSQFKTDAYGARLSGEPIFTLLLPEGQTAARIWGIVLSASIAKIVWVPAPPSGCVNCTQFV